MTDAPLVDSARIFALIPAAGIGRRMGADCPKQYMPIAGVPMLVRTVEALLAASRVERVFVVVSPEDSYIDHAAESFAKWGDRVKILRAGGAERADSVLGGLRAACLPPESWVLVHDAFTTRSAFDCFNPTISVLSVSSSERYSSFSACRAAHSSFFSFSVF